MKFDNQQAIDISLSLVRSHPKSRPSPSLILGWPLNRSDKSSAETSLLNLRRTRNLSQALQYTEDRHLLTFAPTGSGKGVGVIIPNLLHYEGPAIVIDPKGENFAVTARYRQEVLKQTVFLLDPFHAVPDSILARLHVKRERLNPLDLCQLSETDVDLNAQMLAQLFAGDSLSLNDPFWDNCAKRVVAGLLVHEMERALKGNRPPTMAHLVNILFSDDPISSMKEMLAKEKPSIFVMKSIGGGLIGIDADGTKAGILSVAQSYFSLFTTGNLLECLNTSSMSLKDIQMREDYTLYIVIPPTKLDSHRTLLKSWVWVLMHCIMERKTQPALRTLFILDECANLGEMEILRKAVTLLRGYGLQVWMFFQDLAQLQSLYPDSGTMINNCGVLQTFGSGRSSAADPIAKIMGSLKANDLMQMDERQQALSVMPGRPYIARLARYYKDEAFAGRFDINPLIRASNKQGKANRPRIPKTDITL